MIAFAKPDNILAMPTKNNEWFTPARYVEAARSVMGSIDLDPASCFEANRTVRAKCYYTIKDDGLAQEWKGNTWLNPPYGRDKSAPNEQRSTVGKWVTKLVQCYEVGSVTQAILLVTCSVNAAWFDCLWRYSICFPKEKIRFFLPHGSQSKSRIGRNFDSHMYGSVLVYLGPNNERFTEVFSEFGSVIPVNVAVRRQQIMPLSLWEVSK